MRRIVQHRRNVFALQMRWDRQSTQTQSRRIQIEQLDEAVADRGPFTGHADDQRHAGRFVSQRHLGPEVMFAQMVAVIAGEDHDRVVFQPVRLERVKHFADLRIHEGDRSVVATHRFLLAADVHLHVQAGFVVDARFGNVVPIALDFSGSTIFSIRQERREIRTRRNERNVRTNETDAQPKRFVFGVAQISSTALAAVLPSE